jgi:hypothetical protein
MIFPSLKTNNRQPGDGGGSRESAGSWYLRTTLLTVFAAAASAPVVEKLGFSFSTGGASGVGFAEEVRVSSFDELRASLAVPRVEGASSGGGE